MRKFRPAIFQNDKSMFIWLARLEQNILDIYIFLNFYEWKDAWIMHT